MIDRLNHSRRRTFNDLARTSPAPDFNFAKFGSSVEDSQELNVKHAILHQDPIVQGLDGTSSS